MKHLYLILIACILCCCTHTDPTQVLNRADEDLQQGKFENVRGSLLHLLENKKIELTPIHLCRVALLYAQLAEQTDNTVDLAEAAYYYEKAYSENPNQVEDFILGLEGENQSHAQLLIELSRALTVPDNLSQISQEADSLENFPDYNPIDSL